MALCKKPRDNNHNQINMTNINEMINEYVIRKFEEGIKEIEGNSNID